MDTLGICLFCSPNREHGSLKPNPLLAGGEEVLVLHIDL